MKKFSFLLALILIGCSPRVTTNLKTSYDPLNEDEPVAVLGIGEPRPDNSVFLGTVSIGDTGFTMNGGSYDEVVSLAKERARQAGGNVLRITKHTAPDWVSSIHRIQAEILRAEGFHVADETIPETINPEHLDYAVICFFRESASMVNYDVYIGEDRVYRAKNYSAKEVRLYDFGEIEIWAKTESKSSLILDIVPGGEYYVYCGVSTGFFVGHPSFQDLPAQYARNRYLTCLSGMTGTADGTGSEIKGEFDNVSSWRLAVQGGGSIRTAKSDSDMPSNYMNHLKRGYSYGADIEYFFYENMGVGIRYHNFHGSAAAIGTHYIKGNRFDGYMSDDIDISYIGPIVTYRLFSSSNKHVFLTHLGLGYMRYVDNAFLNRKVKLSGSTFGAVCGFGYDYNFSKHFAIGAELGLYSGVLKSMTAEAGGVRETQSLDKDHYEGLGHIDLSFGLRYNF